MSGIFNLLFSIINELSYNTVNLIGEVFTDGGSGLTLSNIDFNLSLFSDNPIISTNLWDLLLLFFTIFYSMFFIVLLYKVTKKFITMIFGVFRV